jgi:hypothetical protein
LKLNFLENIPASLVIGGYDASRFDQTTTISSSMHHQVDNRSFTIWLGDMSVNDPAKSPQPMYQPKLIVDLDFTSPYISLPNEACRGFEKALGLNWDSETRLYLVNDTTHQDLLSRDVEISFMLYGYGGNHQFMVPYKALVLTAKPPLVAVTTKYFAVQRSMTGNYFLGRAFLQSVYMTAVFDHPSGGYFNLSQARYSDQGRQKIVAINAADIANGTTSVAVAGTDDSKPKIIPYIVSGLIAFAAFSAYLGWAWYTRHFPFAFRRQKINKLEPSDPETPVSAKPEMEGHSTVREKPKIYEVEGDSVLREMQGDAPPAAELPGWLPPEADSKPKK